MKTPLLIVILLASVGPLRAASSPFGQEVRFDQEIGQSLPLATDVIDVTGAHHRLGDYFRGRPVVLYFGYASCPQLCSLVADGTVAALRQIRRSVGKDVDVVALSIDPTESSSAAEARVREAVHRYGDPKAITGWHYLRGSADAVRAITDAAGFHFVYDARSQQYAHPSGFVIVTPQGIISRYFLGLDFDAAEAARALDRAAQGKTGEPVFSLLLACFRGDGFSGRYDRIISGVLIVSVIATVLALAGGIVAMLRAERRRRALEGGPS